MKKIFSIHIFAFISILSLISSCKTGKLSKSDLIFKNTVTLDSLFHAPNYKIDIDMVYPFNTQATTQVVNALLWNTGNNANQINVSGNGNYIKIKNDSIYGYLQFFGERRLNAGDYGGTNTAIQFEDALDNIKKVINTEKQKLEIDFKVNQKGNDTDKYEVRLDIYPNHKVSVDISPVFRTFIKYRGELVTDEEDSSPPH